MYTLSFENGTLFTQFFLKKRSDAVTICDVIVFKKFRFHHPADTKIRKQRLKNFHSGGRFRKVAFLVSPDTCE